MIYDTKIISVQIVNVSSRQAPKIRTNNEILKSSLRTERHIVPTGTPVKSLLWTEKHIVPTGTPVRDPPVPQERPHFEAGFEEDFDDHSVIIREPSFDIADANVNKGIYYLE